MGKIKNDSSDEDMEMDIEHPVQLAKKNKTIAKKNKQQGHKRTQSSSTKSQKSIVHQLAKSVNLKNKAKSLQHKQQIFNKIVNGLKDKTEASKKNKKKSRVLLKKELRKYLDQEKVHLRKKSEELTKKEDIIIQHKNPEKAKKRLVDERQKSKQFRGLMGTGLDGIRNMIAKNTMHNQNRQ